MSSVTSGYGRYSVDSESYLASRGLFFGKGQNTADEKDALVRNTLSGDAVSLSKQAVVISAKARTQEELDALNFEEMFSFTAEDGSTISVQQALEGEEGEEFASAIRIIVTRPDGAEESIYIDGYLAAAEALNENATVTEETEEEDAEQSIIEETLEEETAMTLMDLIRSHGLGDLSADGAGGALSDAIRARITAMIEATEKTREEQEELEAAKEAHTTAEGDERVAATPDGPFENTGQTGRVMAYTSRGTAASQQGTFRTGGFSRSL